MITAHPVTPDAYRLLHDGSLALAAVERAGIHIDVDYLKKAQQQVADRIAALRAKMEEQPEFGEQRKRFGAAAAVNNRDQLAHVLYDVHGHACHSTTGTGKRQLDNTALERVGTKYAKAFVRLAKLEKLHSTYITNVLREVSDGVLHAGFSLNIPRTYRSSSSDPNFQNIPIRDPMIAEIIRRAFVARPGPYVLVEIDYVSAEVRVAACYHQDPTMIQYIADDYDLHSDMAAECYLLDGKVPKPVRATAKGSFVFAEFYGDYWKSVAANLWDAAERYRLRTAEEVCVACSGTGTGSKGQQCHPCGGTGDLSKPLLEHLARKGIRALGNATKGTPTPGTFQYHIKQVEDRFWGKRFPVYDQWRRDWWDEYCRVGSYPMLTGFRVSNPHSRNEVINGPVQGAAFHCLLRSLIQLVKRLKRKTMRTRIVGQIHDSILADVHCDELGDFLAMARQVMVTDLRAAWPWVTVPMEIEAEVCPQGGSWWDKAPVELPT